MKITLNEHTHIIDDAIFKEYIESKGKKVELSKDVLEALKPTTDAEIMEIAPPEFRQIIPTLVGQINIFLEKRKARMLSAM